jgi:hypothetical protein
MNDIRIIMLGGSRGGFAIVDADRFEEINSHKWRLSSHGYVIRSQWNGHGADRIYLHKFLKPELPYIDHRNRHPIDNTDRNLRSSTHRQNIWNSPARTDPKTSQFKGVHRQRSKWCAQHNHVHIGVFESEIEAAKAYNAAAKECCGEFAYLNPV